jgi:plasmid replication initiation protein
MQTELETNDLVVRHNKLINAVVRLDAKEYDLVRTFMKYVLKKDSEFWTFSVLASELGINKTRCKPMVKSIQRKPLEIEIGKEGIVSMPFFSTLKYYNGVFEGKFNNDLKDLLLQMDGDFTKTFEKYILPMNSIYAKRIYEMLIENKKIGFRKFKLENLYETLRVPKSMMKYSNFKAFVLVIAIKEINKHSDIYIPVDTQNLKDESWKRLQCGKVRKITHLNFDFRMKSDKGLFEDKKVIFKIEDIRELLLESIAPVQAHKSTYEYLLERLEDYLIWVEKEDFKTDDWVKSFNFHCDGYKKNFAKIDERI